jgi:hypothetical protein
MPPRSSLVPPIDDPAAVSLETVLDHLRGWHRDTLATVERLRGHRTSVEANQRQLEGPQAAVQFIEGIVDVLGGCAADFERTIAEIAAGVSASHAVTLKGLATRAANEESRCLRFRDKWLNKPLPYEAMRPLLSAIATDARDQLVDYRAVKHAVAQIETLVRLTQPADEPASSDDARVFDRRALFTRFLPREHDEHE